MIVILEIPWIILLLLPIVRISATPSSDHHAKLILIDDTSQRYELNGRQCHGGVFITQPKRFKCACVFGVWGFYEKYCEKPLAIVAGQNECFKVPENMEITQFIIFGNPDYPFEPVITHFREDYSIFTNYYASDTRGLDLDPSAPFITITSHSWELESDTGEVICLTGGSTSSKKQFCYYHAEHWSESQNTPWNLIVRIRKGCRANTTKQYSTNCDSIPSNPDFPKENGIEVCTREIKRFINNTRPTQPPKLTTTPQTVTVITPTPSPTTSVPLVDFPEFMQTTVTPATTQGTTGTTMLNLTSVAPLVDFPELPEATSTKQEDGTTESTTVGTQGQPIMIDFPNPELLPDPMTTTEQTYPDTCETGITRETVKTYWSSDEIRDCPKSSTDAVFVNQLQRIAASTLKKIFPERLNSLTQAEELLRLNLLLISKTCPTEAVRLDFLTDISEAFNSFIQEDFYYGLEELDPLVFKRFTTTLQNCIERATTFNISMEKRECQNLEITGNFFNSDGSMQTIVIPESASSSNFEPIIEGAWKMFLNAHAYCYEDFDPINDHHHFSTFFFSLFSESIYEKCALSNLRNSPLDFSELYKFVIPSTSNLVLTMKNLDYCVGATNLISNCQTWLHRTSAEPIREREKRSVWDSYIGRSRDESRIWNGLGHCLHSPEEPAFKLGYAKCSHPVK